MTSIDVSIDPSVFARVPDYRRIVVSTTIGDPLPGAAVIDQRLDSALSSVITDYATTPIIDIPPVESWRRAFKDVGINPSKFRPAMEALLRRAVRGDDLRLGHPLIDLGTAVSLSTLCPVGMHTVDGIGGPLQLRPANGGEVFTTFAGDNETPDVGEIVYSSGTVVLTRRWAWRQGAVGSIDPGQPCRLAVNIDVLDQDRAARAVGQLTTLLTACGAQRIDQVTLSSASPTGVLTW